MTYDSRPDTYAHIHEVQRLLLTVIQRLQLRSLSHDQSKLYPPEIAIFDEYTPKLKNMEFGSYEYKENLVEMKPGLDHHYSHNSHHPNFYLDGINGMSLTDLFEMLCDWMAAVKRQPSGDIHKSIEINTSRYDISDQLKQILVNTVAELE
ncbi:MAG: DUF5662 family protein [Candidatus Micrarchaeaceae archaeon]